ncbi:MAG: hypothetical protein QXU32_02150 [Nitrososphaerales archaeon]
MSNDNLPPGVNPSDIDMPYSDKIMLRCENCGKFISNKPYKTEKRENYIECDGKVSSYDVEYDDALIRVLGEEFRGKTYKVYVATCGEELPNGS